MTLLTEDTETPKEEELRSFADFLESSPPNTPTKLADVGKIVGTHHVLINTPEIQLHCPTGNCNGVRFFRCSDQYSGRLTRKRTNIFINYICSNCKKYMKTFSIMAQCESELATIGTATKYGEYPVYGPPTPPKLLKLVGPDRSLFLKGRRCENQGLGVGAFTYYRRVVENQKNRILGEILKVSEKLNMPEDRLSNINEAIKETQFTKSLTLVKDSIPESLLINGHNPILLLHDALSDGVHNLEDDDCLAYASSIRVILGELSDRISQALKEEAELSHALSTLLARKRK